MVVTSLDVLVVDDRPETVRFLTEFLVQRCRRVDVASSVREAVSAVTRRRAAGEKYHLVLSDFVMPDADGLALLRELRGRQDDVPFVFITGYRALNPTFEPEAQRLGVLAILDKPIDLQQVEEILNRGTAIFRRKRDAASGDQPFFGTSRVIRRQTDVAPPPPTAASDALEPRSAQPQAPPPQRPVTASYQARPVAKPGGALEPHTAPIARPAQPPPPVAPPPNVPPAGYQRRPSGIIAVGPTTTTSRTRRSVNPMPPSLPPAAGPSAPEPITQPQTSFTARIRRGVEGTDRVGKPPARTESGRMVSCTACGRSFLVAAKAETYTTVCVHCGQLQRIDPA